MLVPKYNFYIGKLKANFTTLRGYYNVNDSSGAFVTDQYSRASELVEVPESRKVIFTQSAIYSSTGRIVFYDVNKKYIAYNTIARGVMEIRTEAKYYAVSYQYNDGALMDEYFLADAIGITPHYKELSKKYAKENGQEFFRASLDGKITLFGADYKAIWDSTIEDKHVFCIEKYNAMSKKWNSYYIGTFSKTDCKFDGVQRSCELSGLSTADAYVNVLNKYDNTYDLIKLAPATTRVAMFKRSAIQIYIAGGNTISTFFNGTYMEEEVDTIIDDGAALENNYYFAYISTFNEMYIGGISAYPNVSGQYISADSRWTNGKGYNLRLVKVASAGEYFSGTYARSPIYNINTAESVNNQTVVPGETGGTYITYDTYALRLFDIDDTTIIAESDLLFYVPDTSKAYIFGFDTLTMNITGGGSIRIENIIIYKVYQRLLCDADSVLSIPTHALPLDDFVRSPGNFKRAVGLQNQVLGYIIYSAATSDEPTKYGQNDFGKYFTSDFLSAISGIDRLLPVCRSSWANSSIWFAYNTFMLDIVEPEIRVEYELKDAYAIGDVIKALLKEIDPSIRHDTTDKYSTFLYSNSNTINSSNFRVVIAPKSNILKGEYDQAAQKAEVTLEDIMNMLAKCFQCYWFIDENNNFRIEHIYYFNNNKSYSANTNYQLDFTAYVERRNGKIYDDYQRSIEFDKADLNSRYEFGWMDDVTEAFGSVTMDIKSNYVQQDKTEDITVNQFSSDVDFMLYNPDNFSSDGFALLCPIMQNSKLTLPIIEATLLDENGDSYKAKLQNWYASWTYLAANMYRYAMPAQVGTINTYGQVHTTDLIRSMQQEIELFYEEDLDTGLLIKTHLGYGKVEEMSIKIDTRLTKVSLVYKPS